MARVLGSGLLAFVALNALAAKAHATNGLFCQGTLDYPEGRYVCVGSQAAADYVPTRVSLGLGPDRMDVSVAATGEVATSSYGAASAEVSAKVGTLSGKTHAQVLTVLAEPDANWISSGLASAAFRDTVLIQGRPGVPLGTPVVAHLRTQVQGVFSGASAKNILAAEADFTGQLSLLHAAGGQTQLAAPLSGVFWSYQGHTGENTDTLLPNVKTGDSLDVRWALTIESGVNQINTLSQTDSEIVARLFIDLEPTIAIAVGQTAYGYRPEDGAAGEGGAGGEAGSSVGTGSDAGESMGGASNSAGDAGEGGDGAVGGSATPSAGGARASAGQGGTGHSSSDSSDSSGCSLSAGNLSGDRRQLAFALAAGAALLSLARRRRTWPGRH